MDNKQAIRQLVKAKRQQLTALERQQYSQQICQKVISLPLFLQSKRIACYLAANNEVDVQIVIDYTLNSDKQCLLPIISPTNPNELWFAPYCQGDKLVKNRYGILEPYERIDDRVPNNAIDLVITPLVAFDNQLNRLGMGGGYYDRSFSFLLKNEPHTTHLMGVAYDFQKVAALATENCDVPLHLVVTNTQTYQ